jgi:thiosulfate/3-mercaptopyruvate sulfurtransferase
MGRRRAASVLWLLRSAHRLIPLREREGFFVDKAEVVAVAEGRAPGRLVCVLRPPVFSGRENVYARPRHIPSSLNVPYVNLLGRRRERLPPRN